MSYITDKKWYEGLYGLLTSTKAMMALIVLSLSFVALMTKHIDGTPFAAIVSVVGTIFMSTHAYASGKFLEASKAGASNDPK